MLTLHDSSACGGRSGLGTRRVTEVPLSKAPVFTLSLPLQTWDKDLAATAREWARRCLFEHNPDPKGAGRVPNASSVGENIWTGYPPSSFNAAGAIQNWVDEKQHYDYDRNACSDVCGHYKQVGLRTGTSAFSAKRNDRPPTFVLLCFSRSSGEAPTKSAALPNCAPTESERLTLPTKKASFLCATTLQREGKTMSFAIFGLFKILLDQADKPQC